MDVVWQVLLTLLLGAGGWFLAHFLASPASYFWQLRRQIHSDLIFYGNVLCNIQRGEIPDHMKEPHAKAQTAFRRHSADIKAFHEAHQSIEAILKMYWRNLDVHRAGEDLMGLSNSVADDATIRDHVVRKRLCLPKEMPDDLIKEMDELRRNPRT